MRQFLDAIDLGKVPAGSYLLVESLDRLSRDRVTAAMRLFLDITERGVNIVTLSDGQTYRAGQTEFPQLIYSMAIMSRANEESQIKSLRVGAAWKRKRDAASTKKLTAMAPKWLAISNDRRSFDVIDDRAEVVRRLYRLAGDGHGTYSITQILNREHVPPFGRSNGWNESYVDKILKSRTVLGEYQPHSKVDGKRIPIGEPISGYYPEIVDETTFLAVQASRRKRATAGGGRKGRELKNLFTHIATCAYCGAPMRMVDKGAGPKGGRYLKCSTGVRGLACTKKGWRYKDFERSFLFLAKEVDLHRVLNAEALGRAEAELDQKIAAATEKTTQLQTQRERLVELSGDPSVGIAFIRGKLADVRAQLEETAELLNGLRAQRGEQTNEVEGPDDLRQLIDDLGGLSGTQAYELRSRLANRLRSLVVFLKISTEGERPQLARTRQFLDASWTEPDIRDAILGRIEEVAIAGQRYNPTFHVQFVGGTQRKAIVTTKDAMQYVSEVVVSADGSVDLDGRRFDPGG